MAASRFLTLTQIRQIESEAEIKLDLMAEAGAMIAKWIEHNLAKASKILVLVGGGNNGGDGVAAAINLKRAGYAVSLLCVTEKINPRIDQLITQFKQLQGQVLVKLPKTFAKYTVIVDAILGIGLDRDLDDQLVTLVKQVNASGKFILAIDTPTGLNPFSGGVMSTAIQANHTLTFISDKPGFYTGDGVDLAGKVTVVPLVKLENYVLTPNHAPILGNELVQINYQALIRRHRNTNKGDFGTVAIIGGSAGMQGALHLAGRAALLMGSGKVILGPLDSRFTKDYLYPELIVKNIKHLIKHIDQYSAIVVGPGLGLEKKAVKLLAKLIEQAPPGKLIFDADALNILALNPELQQKFMQLPVKVITPHPGEAARLLATTVEAVQHNRFAAVTQLSRRYKAIVLLKGAGSLIHDTASIFINQTGNPALASGGQGDTLCGLIVACAAQGMELAEALKFAVYLHGLAADDLVATTLHGYNGILASEVALSCRKLLNNILYPN